MSAITAEVSLDLAVDTSFLPEDVTWLDNVIYTTITSTQEEMTDIPVEILGLRLLVNDKNFVERDASLSVVDCFNYLFMNIEKIQQDVETVSLEASSALISCSRDLAASHLRLAESARKVEATLDTGDLAMAFQQQCDVTFVTAVRGSGQDFRSSIRKEVKLLLMLRNFEDAYLKIIKYKVFTDGLELLSNHIKTVDLNQFDEMFALRKRLFEKFLDFMDEEGGCTEHEIKNDRDIATIIVDANGARGFKDGKFHVQDFTSALKLVQNGGIIFLENGDYTTDTFFDVKQKSQDPGKVITIIGASSNQCSIHGTVKINAEQKVTFKRIKFEVGDSADSNDAIYVLGGHAVFTNCLLEATVNTLWYIIGQEASSPVTLTVQHCVVDGLESCQRAVTFQGQDVAVNLLHSLLRDMFSLLWCDGQTENISLVMDGCGVEDVQTGVHLSLSTNLSTCHLLTCNFTLVLYDQDAAMSAVEVNGGQAVIAEDNNIIFKHIDGKGFAIKDVNSVSLTRNCIKSINDVDRKLAVGEAIVIENVKKVDLEKLHLCGFRIGMKFKETLAAFIWSTLIENCSVGISVLKSRPRQQRQLKVVATTFQTMYYGVMGEDLDTLLSLHGSQFKDIPKALLLSQEMLTNLEEDSCTFLLSREYTTSSQVKILESEMNLYLATSENLPHRVAYEREDIQLVFKFGTLGFIQ